MFSSRVIFYVLKGLLMCPITTERNAILILTPYFFKFHFNITHRDAPGCKETCAVSINAMHVSYKIICCRYLFQYVKTKDCVVSRCWFRVLPC
jgi:hypothetical protein